MSFGSVLILSALLLFVAGLAALLSAPGLADARGSARRGTRPEATRSLETLARAVGRHLFAERATVRSAAAGMPPDRRGGPPLRRRRGLLSRRFG